MKEQKIEINRSTLITLVGLLFTMLVIILFSDEILTVVFTG